MFIAKRLNTVLDKINSAAARAGRTSAEIKLVTVSKTVAPAQIIEAHKAGAYIFGENKVQEARDKIKQMTDFSGVQWHMIGNLQKNKAKTAVRLFDVIHSLNSVELAEELNKQAEKINKIQNVLVQIKLSDEVTKYGIAEKDLFQLFEKISNMKNLRFEGLMVIPPFFEDPEMTRPYFRKLREIADKAAEKGFTVRELSMGMSNDFEVAIEEGATMVRVGSSIFGERHY